MRKKFIQIFIVISLNIFLLCQDPTILGGSYEKRVNFAKNYTDLVTGGKVSFPYSEENGMFCKAESDIYKKEFIFKIPSRFVTSSFDMFPFKFELLEPINKFLIERYGWNHTETVSLAPTYIMAFNLMFLKYQNKKEIFDYLKETKKEY